MPALLRDRLAGHRTAWSGIVSDLRFTSLDRKPFIDQRQRTNAFADSGEDGVGNSWRYRRGGRLADAAWIGGAGDDMDLYLWHLRQPDHVVVGKICLHHPTVLDRDPAVKGSRHAVDDAALDLGLDAVGIDRRAAIDRSHNAFHGDFAVLNRDLGDLGNDAAG